MDKDEEKEFSCGDSVKLAGFTSVTKVCILSEVSRNKMYEDFHDRNNTLRKSKYYDYLRRAMDKKHMIERSQMEGAIINMKSNKEGDE